MPLCCDAFQTDFIPHTWKYLQSGPICDLGNLITHARRTTQACGVRRPNVDIGRVILDLVHKNLLSIEPKATLIHHPSMIGREFCYIARGAHVEGRFWRAQ